MTAPIVQMFVNPRAGSWYRGRVGVLRSAFETAGVTVIVTESRLGEPEVDDRAEHVCVVGGDGTMRHVVAAVRRAARPVTVSVYPAGTVNLLATECGYPRDPRAFVARVLNGAVRRDHYIGLIGDIPLLTCASVGPDSFAIARLSPRLKRLIGRAAYVVAFIGVLLNWPRPKLQVTVDGQRIDCEAVYIAKGRYFAGRWTFAPEASVTEPLFHVLTVDKATRLRFLALAWAFVRGRVAEAEGVRCFTCIALGVRSELWFPFQADGDVVTELPVEIRLSDERVKFE